MLSFEHNFNINCNYLISFLLVVEISTPALNSALKHQNECHSMQRNHARIYWERKIRLLSLLPKLTNFLCISA